MPNKIEIKAVLFESGTYVSPDASLAHMDAHPLDAPIRAFVYVCGETRETYAKGWWWTTNDHKIIGARVGAGAYGDYNIARRSRAELMAFDSAE